MRLDKYSNPIFNEKDFFDALYKGYQINPNDIIFVDNPDQFQNLGLITSQQFFSSVENLELSIQEFDQSYQETWNMPEEYLTMDIEGWLHGQCPPWDPEHTRLSEELTEFKERNMLNLLRWLKYFVDTCRSNNIVWGVGRGSSVASYVLYLIGVHKIDPIKYNLDWQEFLR